MLYEEFLGWLAYNEINPLPPYRYDALLALMSSLVANVFSSGKTKFKPADFMPEFKTRSQSSQDAVSISDKLDKLLELL